ncbi:MAG: carboxymuconolactone decarboxylase family protein [Alphaproteobacteria bacterium]
MPQFKIHDLSSAPADSKKDLEAVNAKFGFIPNIFGIMAEAPAALKAYPAFAGAFEQSSFSPAEREIVAIATGTSNGCSFCTAVHSTIARRKLKVDDGTVDALRNQTDLPDAKQNALAKFTKAIAAKRGAVSDEDTATFKKAGYSDAQVLELVVGVALNTFTNYINNVARTPMNEEFKAEDWSASNNRRAA